MIQFSFVLLFHFYRYHFFYHFSVLSRRCVTHDIMRRGRVAAVSNVPRAPSSPLPLPPPTPPPANAFQSPPFPKNKESLWKVQLVEAFVRGRCDRGRTPDSDEIVAHALSSVLSSEVAALDLSPVDVLRRLNHDLRLGAIPGKPTCYTWGSSYFYQTGTNDEKKEIRRRRRRRRKQDQGAPRTTRPRMVMLMGEKEKEKEKEEEKEKEKEKEEKERRRKKRSSLMRKRINSKVIQRIDLKRPRLRT